MSSDNIQKPSFFDADIIYEASDKDIYFLSSLFSYLVAIRPRYHDNGSANQTYEYWCGYFSALVNVLKQSKEKKIRLELYQDEYLFLRSVADDSFVLNWVDTDAEVSKLKNIFDKLDNLAKN